MIFIIADLFKYTELLNKYTQLKLKLLLLNFCLSLLILTSVPPTFPVREPPKKTLILLLLLLKIKLVFTKNELKNI